VSSGEPRTWFGERLEEHVVLLPELDALVPVVGAQRGQEVTGEGYDATTGDLK
jgi:hypothetical protein